MSEITGNIIQIMDEQKGTSKAGSEWTKQDFVIETVNDKFPKKVCISAQGQCVEHLQKFHEGQSVKVNYNLESREWNSKWFTDVRAWKIESN